MASDNVSLIILLMAYSDVPPCILPKCEPKIPAVDGVSMVLSRVSTNPNGECEWLNKVVTKIGTTEEPHHITRAGHHPEIRVQELQLVAMFCHNAHTSAIIRHSLTVVDAAFKHLNPGQIPIVAFDQPLFALAKQLQWHYPERFGEDKFLVMGGLYIEMAVLRILGHSG
jgi:hypothetical protein